MGVWFEARQWRSGLITQKSTCCGPTTPQFFGWKWQNLGVYFYFWFTQYQQHTGFGLGILEWRMVQRNICLWSCCSWKQSSLRKPTFSQSRGWSEQRSSWRMRSRWTLPQGRRSARERHLGHHRRNRILPMNPSERQGRDALDVFESGQNISQHVAGAVFDSIHRKHFNSSTLGFSKCTKNVLQFKFLQSKNVIIIISYIIIKVPILKRCWVANSHYFGHIGEWNRGW